MKGRERSSPSTLDGRVLERVHKGSRVFCRKLNGMRSGVCIPVDVLRMHFPNAVQWVGETALMFYDSRRRRFHYSFLSSVFK